MQNLATKHNPFRHLCKHKHISDKCNYLCTSPPDKEVVVVKVLSGDELAVEEQPEVPRPRPPLVRVLELVADLLGDALGVPGIKVIKVI